MRPKELLCPLTGDSIPTNYIMSFKPILDRNFIMFHDFQCFNQPSSRD